MDGTLSPSIKGDDETISDPSFSTSFFPPVTNNAGNDQTTIGPVLQSFEVDGQHYEIRSYEEAETSNLREDPNDFQDVQNRRSKKAGKRGTAPRTIKTRTYDPNLEVGTVTHHQTYSKAIANESQVIRHKRGDTKWTKGIETSTSDKYFQ
ncbi:unnamed protein product [Cuscuta campestris]|uniref:Uncharacterized protein n=1 Tax=Cuscuta campestris TaxID=132261 RepID=A0A484NGD6_9ASTE|nr:unnamed protein product [Cuscuta campestris]